MSAAICSNYGTGYIYPAALDVFKDVSWRNDTCAQLWVRAASGASYVVFVEHRDPALRDADGESRFNVWHLDIPPDGEEWADGPDYDRECWEFEDPDALLAWIATR